MCEAPFYDELIMDHIRNARNYRVVPDANRRASGSNPLCGDEITVFVTTRGKRLADISFQCECCGISMASASIMTEMLNALPENDAQIQARAFVARITAREGCRAYTAPSEAERALLETVRRFPSRNRCAALPWQTLLSALETPPGADTADS